MQIFSFFVLAIILWITVSTKSSKDRFIKILILNIVLATHFESGYFFSAGGFELGYDQVTSVFTAFFGLLAIKGKFKKGALKTGALFYGSILAGVVGLVFFPYGERIVTGAANNYDDVISGVTKMQYASFDTSTISGLLFFGIFVVIVLCAYQLIDNTDVKYIVFRLSVYFKWIIIYGVCELILVYLFNTNAHRLVINSVMGMGRATFSDLIIRDNGYMLQGLTREASHYMFALFITMVIIVAAGAIQKQNTTFWVITYFILSFFSFSLSTVIYSIGFILYYMLILIRENPESAKDMTGKLLIYIGIGLFLLIIVMLVAWNTRGGTDNYLLQRMGEAEEVLIRILTSDSTSILRYYSYSDSSFIRIYSVIETFKLFLHRPILGLGMGVITCHGSTMMFLGDVGIAGVYFWYKLMKQFKKKALLDYVAIKMYTLSIVLYIIINILSSTYLVPFQSPVVLAYVLAGLVVFQNRKTIAGVQ